MAGTGRVVSLGCQLLCAFKGQSERPTVIRGADIPSYVVSFRVLTVVSARLLRSSSSSRFVGPIGVSTSGAAGSAFLLVVSVTMMILPAPLRPIEVDGNGSLGSRSTPRFKRQDLFSVVSLSRSWFPRFRRVSVVLARLRLRDCFSCGLGFDMCGRLQVSLMRPFFLPLTLISYRCPEGICGLLLYSHRPRWCICRNRGFWPLTIPVGIP